jgi:hypothetical protein
MINVFTTVALNINMTVIYNGKKDLPKYGLTTDLFGMNVQVYAYDQNIIIVIITQIFLQGTSVLCTLMMTVTHRYIQRIMYKFSSLAAVRLVYSIMFLEAWSCF